MPNKQMTYIGDGVYVSFENLQLKLCANSPTEPTDTIYLEPFVLEALNHFYDQCMEELHDRKYQEE